MRADGRRRHTHVGSGRNGSCRLRQLGLGGRRWFEILPASPMSAPAPRARWVVSGVRNGAAAATHSVCCAGPSPLPPSAQGVGERGAAVEQPRLCGTCTRLRAAIVKAAHSRPSQVIRRHWICAYLVHVLRRACWHRLQLVQLFIAERRPTHVASALAHSVPYHELVVHFIVHLFPMSVLLARLCAFALHAASCPAHDRAPAGSCGSMAYRTAISWGEFELCDFVDVGSCAATH